MNKLIWELSELKASNLHFGAGWRVADVTKPEIGLRVLDWDIENRMLTVTAECPGWQLVLAGYRIRQSLYATWIGFVLTSVRIAEVWGLGKRQFGCPVSLRQIYSIDWACRQFEGKKR